MCTRTLRVSHVQMAGLHEVCADADSNSVFCSFPLVDIGTELTGKNTFLSSCLAVLKQARDGLPCSDP